MLAEVAELLRCPHCESACELTDRVLSCARGHRFDLARQGYVNLLTRAAPRHADTAEMVAERADFLSGRHFDPLIDLLGTRARGSRLLEVGAGTGHYLAGVRSGLGENARGLATDLSAYACRRAARLPRVGAVVADTWAGLPVLDGVIDTLLCVFAPRNPAEFARVLAPQGRVLVLTPTEHHLAELRSTLGLLEVERGKRQRLHQTMGEQLTLLDEQELAYHLDLTASDLRRLVAMGPNAFHHSDPAVPERAEVTVSVRLSTFGHR
ncbi:23S rRNA methyltransferase [Naumannella sp. ID2617S]|nr:23S rRNA methyltransferase [Naumannella sp. ID2617S]